MSETTTTKPRAVVDRPDSVTHFICPETEKGVLTAVTHHMVNAKCRYCGKLDSEIRAEVGL